MRQKNNRVRWFINSHEMNRYSILREIAVNSHLTQAELGNRVGLSTAMVNAYMKELVYDGVIEYHKKLGGRYHTISRRTGIWLCAT